jgi:hypothetical protein
MWVVVVVVVEEKQRAGCGWARCLFGGEASNKVNNSGTVQGAASENFWLSVLEKEVGRRGRLAYLSAIVLSVDEVRVRVEGAYALAPDVHFSWLSQSPFSNKTWFDFDGSC